jgi:RNA 3'-terminal phosphate cyclase (ATP)
MYQVIDGSAGEGGGQILRTSLTMSALLGKPIKIIKIRAGRRQPGLQAQHLTCVNALTKITDAEVDGASLGSQELIFTPRSLNFGDYKFDVSDVKSSAGSASLIFQAIFLPLAFTEGVSRVTIYGGTNVSWSPPTQYLQMVYLPIAEKMGAKASIGLKNWGWYPKGGGQINIEIQPAKLHAIDLSDRGIHKGTKVLTAVSNLPISIAQRQRDRALDILKSEGINAESELINAPSIGQGTSVFILTEFENCYAGFDSLGTKGKRAEQVAEEACEDCLKFLKSGMAVDTHLADQIVPLMALAEGRSCFTTSKISLHLLTNIQVAEQFLPVKFQVFGEENHPGKVAVEGIGFNR